MSKSRLYGALVCYGVLAVLKGPFRLAVGIVLAGAAVKSWIAFLRDRWLAGGTAHPTLVLNNLPAPAARSSVRERVPPRAS